MADGVKINVAGVWKDTTPHINVGGTWKTPDAVHINVGGVWKEVWVNGPTVIVAATKLISNFRLNANCSAGVRVHSNGTLHQANNVGSYSSYETWLDGGTNDMVWVQRTIISGTLDTDDGSGRLACTVSRDFSILKTTFGIKTTIIDLKFYDAASGGNLLDTQRVTMIAEKESLE